MNKERSEHMQAYVDEGGELSHENAVELLNMLQEYFSCQIPLDTSRMSIETAIKLYKGLEDSAAGRVSKRDLTD